jgi:hypothetical protein
MKPTSLERRVRQLFAEGKAKEAVALLRTELTATRTTKSPVGSVTDPDHRRQLAALWAIFKICK